MKYFLALCLILVQFSLQVSAFELNDESDSYLKRDGFYEHLNENDDLNQERLDGLRDFLIEKAEWEKQRLQALQSHKKNNQNIADLRGTDAYDLYAEQKKEEYEDYLGTEKEYLANKKGLKKKYPSDLSENIEMDLVQNRPRFDYKKRALYGAIPQMRKSKLTAPTGRFEKTQSFDDFGGSFGGSTSGFIPPPITNPENDFADAAPPVPIPPFDEGDFPPPPPPPVFDEGDGF